MCVRLVVCEFPSFYAPRLWVWRSVGRVWLVGFWVPAGCWVFAGEANRCEGNVSVK